MGEKLLDVKIKAINDLIEINYNRTLGYFTAAKKSKYADLDQLFFDYAFKSQGFAEELKMILKFLGGRPLGNNQNTEKILNAWNDVKAAIGLNSRQAILTSCISGEEVALDYYKEIAVNKEILFTPDEQYIFDQQYHDIASAIEEIKKLKI